jgi:hypothetical protein
MVYIHRGKKKEKEFFKSIYKQIRKGADPGTEIKKVAQNHEEWVRV